MSDGVPEGDPQTQITLEHNSPPDVESSPKRTANDRCSEIELEGSADFEKLEEASDQHGAQTEQVEPAVAEMDEPATTSTLEGMESESITHNPQVSVTDADQPIERTPCEEPVKTESESDIGATTNEAPSEEPVEDTAKAAELPEGLTELEREMWLYEQSENAPLPSALAASVDLTVDEKCQQLRRVVSAGEEDADDADETDDEGGGEASEEDPKRKYKEEDVCFVCKDGGDLIMCDRRSCPKAYHLECIGKDDSFYNMKGKWSCSCHFCSSCETKLTKADYTCITCLN
eukprot:gene9352-11081_t